MIPKVTKSSFGTSHAKKSLLNLCTNRFHILVSRHKDKLAKIIIFLVILLLLNNVNLSLGSLSGEIRTCRLQKHYTATKSIKRPKLIILYTWTNETPRKNRIRIFTMEPKKIRYKINKDYIYSSTQSYMF